MEIRKCASAGTMESSDVYVEVEPASSGLELTVRSVVEQQFGQAIRETVRQVLEEYGVETGRIRVADRGALDCVIRARVETAVLRAKEEA